LDTLAIESPVHSLISQLINQYSDDNRAKSQPYSDTVHRTRLLSYLGALARHSYDNNNNNNNNNNKDTYMAQIRRCSRCANACQRQTEMFLGCSWKWW